MSVTKVEDNGNIAAGSFVCLLMLLPTALLVDLVDGASTLQEGEVPQRGLLILIIQRGNYSAGIRIYF